MFVRQALLADVAGITEIYCSHIDAWQNQFGAPTPYEQLTLYERWRYGGANYSIETCAIWLGHLMQRAEGISLVVEHNEQLVGQAEVFIGEEAVFGHHINIATLKVHHEAVEADVTAALLAYIEQMATVLGCSLITVAYPHDTTLYEAHGYTPHMARHLVSVSAAEGRVFYKARDLTKPDPEQIKNWYMSVGRFQNARQEWEHMEWFIWNSVPKLVESNWHGLHIDITSQPSIVHLHQQDAAPTVATARIWSQHEISSHIISAVRDRAFRLGYERVVMLVSEALNAQLVEAEPMGAVQWLYSKQL